jgi:predicted AAA+ superfamily ATPase
MVLRDVVERHDVSHPKAVVDLAHRLVDNVASMYSINNFTGFLKSLGHKVPKSSVGEYLEWLEDAYAFFSVRLFDASLSRSLSNPKKIYCIDHAMAKSVGSGILVNSGHLLENLIFIGLRAQWKDVFYFRTKNGREVDFIVPTHGKKKVLVQVCESIQSEKTREREFVALGDAMKELHLRESWLVTLNEEERISMPSGHVQLVPAWRFLLDVATGNLTADWS